MDKKVTGKGVVCCPSRLNVFSTILWIGLAFDTWQTFYNLDWESFFDFFDMAFVFVNLIMLIFLFAISRKINHKIIENPEKFLKGIKVYGFIIFAIIANRCLINIFMTIVGLFALALYDSLSEVGIGDVLCIFASVLEIVGSLGFALTLCKGEVKMDEKEEATVKNENDYYKSSSFSSMIEDESELIEAEKALEQENNGE